MQITCIGSQVLPNTEVARRFETTSGDLHQDSASPARLLQARAGIAPDRTMARGSQALPNNDVQHNFVTTTTNHGCFYAAPAGLEPPSKPTMSFETTSSDFKQHDLGAGRQ